MTFVPLLLKVIGVSKESVLKVLRPNVGNETCVTHKAAGNRLSPK
jgi:hypothetical protein